MAEERDVTDLVRVVLDSAQQFGQLCGTAVLITESDVGRRAGPCS
jgi:hypothetical protein